MESSTPQPLNYAVPPPSRPGRPLALIGIAGTVAAAGIFVGATTNSINGLVSPTYFINVMGWYGVTDVWWQSVLQGMFEGSVIGVFLSAIMTTTIGIITRATCTYLIGVRCLGRIMLGVYGLWSVGGFLGVLLAALNPQFFQTNFIGVPSDHGQMLRYAWVGGSIWGAYFGGPLSVIVGLVIFGISWHRTANQQW